MRSIEHVLQDVLPYLVTYVKEGIFNMTPYVYEQLQIDRLDDLLKLAILQQTHTAKFIEHFTQSRHIQKVSTPHIQTEIGHARGRILWQPTLIKQLTHTKQHVVTEKVQRQAASMMHTVVEQVAATIYAWCAQPALQQLFQTRQWAASWTQLLPALNDAARHIKKVPLHVPPRVLTRMAQHKNELYRAAARMYEQLQALAQRRYDAQLLQQALRAFLIVPQQRETLFELYWAVQIMKQQKDVTFYIQDGRTKPLASWQHGETTVTLYHNKAGSARIAFQTTLQELAHTHPFMQATKEAATQFNLTAAALFERKPSPFLWRGRPDLVLEYVKEGILTHVVIGEVKYTANKAYMQQGLQQLLQYMHFMKTTDTPSVSGFLAVYDYPSSKTDNIQLLSLREQPLIHLPELEE